MSDDKSLGKSTTEEEKDVRGQEITNPLFILFVLCCIVSVVGELLAGNPPLRFAGGLCAMLVALSHAYRYGKYDQIGRPGDMILWTGIGAFLFWFS